MGTFDNPVNGPITNPMLARRIRLTAMALLFILLSLAGFATITLSPTLLSTLSGIAVNYPEYVRLINSILAALCAAFLLWPRKGSQLVGRWNDYVGLAFSIFFVFYGLRYGNVLLESQFPQYRHQIDIVTNMAVYLGSYLNNLLFLAAARILLNKYRMIPELQSLTARGGSLQRLKQEWAALRAALPNWYWVMLPVSLLALLEDFAPQLLWLRFPDAIFSIYCLSWFAYALWLSFRVRRRMTLAWLSFVLVLAYAAGQIVFASNPFIAYSVSENSVPNLPPATWVRSYLKSKVADDTYKIAIQLHEEKLKQESARSNGPLDTPTNKPTTEEYFNGAVKFFDGATFAILSPMKLLLFLPAFILYLLSIISTNDFRQALHETTSIRKDYLSEDGILSVIGQSIKADEVRAIIRLPGVRRQQAMKEERVFALVWSAPDAPPMKKGPKIFPLKDNDLLVRAMQTEGKEIIVTNEDEGEVAARLRVVGSPPQTLALIPIKFHGGVIGALQVIFRGYGKYNIGMLEQLKFMAELVAPSVQDFRTVSTADKLSARLSRTPTSKPDNSTQGKLTNGFNIAAEKMVETLYDLLNPLGVGLMLECGFTHVKPIFPKEGVYYDILTRPNIGYHETLKKPEANREEKPAIIIQTDSGPIRIEHDTLSVRTETGRPYEFGSLTLAIRHDKDEFAEPTLAAYYLTRRMMASLIANGIFNAARNSLNTVIQDLGVSLNKENLSVAEWFDKVEAASKEAGFLWAIASEKDGHPLCGRQEHVEVIGDLPSVDREILMSKPLECVPYHVPASDTHHIIQLQFKGTGQRLWLGVERAEFGGELSFQSPWKVFLEKLEDIAGTALVYIEEHQRAQIMRSKEEAEKIKAVEDEWQKTTADFSAMLMHQIVNMADNLRASAGDLLESVSGVPFAPDTDSLASITDMKRNADMMMEMTSAYKKATEMGTPCACYINEAAQQTRKLFQFALRKKEIKLEIDVRPEISVKAPTPVITLVLAALTYNAIDAIQSRGTITIKAEAKEDVVYCKVINTGLPIDDEIKSYLFRPGAKGKNGHSGRGLYFVSRSLSNYKGEIALSYSKPEETCFTFRLPALAN